MAEARININLTLDRPRVGFVVRDSIETVPNYGTWVQLKTDDELWGAPRQVLDGQIEKFDWPMVVNKKVHNGAPGWELRRRYPGFYGKEYDYISMPDWCYHLIYDLIKWAGNYKLPEGRVTKWIEKTGVTPTGRVSYTLPIRKPGDGGWYAVVEPMGSSLWAYNELVGDGKALTDAGNREYGMADPIIPGWNSGQKNYEWLVAPFGGSVMEVTSEFGIYYGLGVIDVNGRPWSLEEVLDKKRYVWTTTITRMKLPNGRYITDDFPSVAEATKATGLPRVGTPIPMFGLGDTIWVRKSSTKILAPGSKVSPYYPAK